ncbi:MAG: 50S ribosomal protein L11 methyltransferase [Desulfomonilaceae bacterium]
MPGRKSKHSINYWTKGIRSVDVGAKLRLVPYWEKGSSKSDRIEVVIDPGPSFGAGDHPTTIMALELLEVAISAVKDANDPATVLDVGTGTGVLAIAGVALGASFAVGLDVDPAAVFVARRNVALNSASNLMPEGTNSSIHMFVGESEAVKGCFNIVVANLAAPTLLNVLESIVAAAKPFVILSGIADAMAEEVVRSYSAAGLRPIESRQCDGWNAVLFKKSGITE